MRTASETVSPIDSSTLVARDLIAGSIRVWIRALAARAGLQRFDSECNAFEWREPGPDGLDPRPPSSLRTRSAAALSCLRSRPRNLTAAKGLANAIGRRDRI